MKDISATHGPFTLKARNGLTRAFYTRAKPGVWFLDAEGETTEDALARLRDTLDGRLAQRPRCPSYAFASPLADEFGIALASVTIPEPVHAMMSVLVAAGEGGMSPTRLAESAGYRDYSAANLHLGLTAKALGEVVGIRPPETPYAKGRDTATAIIASDGPTETETGHFRWIARPEFREAWAGAAR
ncbi:MAG: hypothetical protein ACU0CI_03430 [Shimia sp.]